MTGETEAVRVPLEFYFDYNCPFCYVASERLDRVAARHPIAVHYRFIEIHPESPTRGRALEELGYPPEQWQRMSAALDAMVREDGLRFAERTFTTNTRRALMLAQTVLDERPVAFWRLHRALFRAYFAEARNLGDADVLRDIARSAGVANLVEMAWGSPHCMQRLLAHVEAAQRLHLTGVPTLVVGGRAFAGAVSVDTLEDALEKASRGEASDN